MNTVKRGNEVSGHKGKGANRRINLPATRGTAIPFKPQDEFITPAKYTGCITLCGVVMRAGIL